jgi:Na+-driven multidrug efflux pump
LRNLALLGIGFPFGSCSAILVAGLIAQRAFFPITVSAFSAIGIYSATFLLLRNEMGINAFFLAIISGEIVKFVMLIIFSGFSPKNMPALGQKERAFLKGIRIWDHIAMYFVSAVIGGIVSLMLNTYASHLGEGAITLLAYSLRLFYLIAGFFNGAISLMLVTWLQLLKGNLAHGLEKINRHLKILFFLSTVLLLLALLLKDVLISYIPLDAENVMRFRRGGSIVILCLPFYVMYLALIRVFIAFKKVRFIMTLSLFKVLVVASCVWFSTYLVRTTSFIPLLSFSVSETVIAIVAFIVYDTIIKKRTVLSGSIS